MYIYTCTCHKNTLWILPLSFLSFSLPPSLLSLSLSFSSLFPQLIDMMGPLLKRPVIHNNFKGKYPVLVRMVNEELDAIKTVYDSQLSLAQSPSGPHVHKNMPKVAGVLRWSQELRERTNLAVEKLRDIEHGYACVCVCVCASHV